MCKYIYYKQPRKEMSQVHGFILGDLIVFGNAKKVCNFAPCVKKLVTKLLRHHLHTYFSCKAVSIVWLPNGIPKSG